MKNKILFFLLPFLYFHQIYAQSLPVGTTVLEDYYRRSQLLGLVDSAVSFTLRPLYGVALKSSNVYGPDSLAMQGISKRLFVNTSNTDKKGRIQLLPLIWQQQYNAHHPYGWNDGAMVPSKGYQTLLSAGVYAAYGPLSIRLQPEYVWAQNSKYPDFADVQDDLRVKSYYDQLLNQIDQPGRYGTGAYSSLSWGQSNIALTFDPVSISLSNENLNWGPGIHNSLLMSNNAAGFKHITLNTVRPVSTKIGSFEAQFLAGRLENSGYLPSGANRLYQGKTIYRTKKKEWRYLSGMLISYQPRWVPGLFLGLTRAFQMYHSEMNGGIGDYFPLLMPFQKVKTNEDAKKRDQLASVFMRWVWPAAKAEIYAEYGRNDHSANARDFLLEPDHSAAYLLGFRKIVALNTRPDESILVGLELTQMEQTAVRMVRDAGSWYEHGQVLHGYTNRGEVLGAGIGPGSNLQSLNISWLSGLKRLGLVVERYAHNNDFYNSTFLGTAQKRWIDISTAAVGEWNHKNLIFSAKLSGIRSSNYQYRPDNIFNLQARMAVMYRFY